MSRLLIGLLLFAAAVVVSSVHASEVQVGYEHLSISNNDPGAQLWARFSHQESRSWSVNGRVDYLQRFSRDEAEVTAGITRRFGGNQTLTVEAGVAPDARVLPQGTVMLEFGMPVAAKTAASISTKASGYFASQDIELTAGVEHYLPSHWAIIGRAGVARETYNGLEISAFHPAGLLKAMYFFTDDDRVWFYGAQAVEGYVVGAAHGPTKIATSSWGMGGLKTFKPSGTAGTYGIEGNLDWQTREGAIPTIVTMSLSLSHHW